MCSRISRSEPCSARTSLHFALDFMAQNLHRPVRRLQFCGEALRISQRSPTRLFNEPMARNRR
jgi:hypothetical protein